MSISRGRLSFALLLIGLGTWQLAINFYPEFKQFTYAHETWPFNIIGMGAFLGLIGLLTWKPGWFIPACIVAGVGGILYFANRTENWAAWAYLWTLIPGFVGVGLLLLGLATWKAGPIIAAGWTVFASAVLFGIFGSTLGRLPVAGAAGAAAVILLGLMLLFSGIFRKPRVS
jgi:hypothetical protein